MKGLNMCGSVAHSERQLSLVTGANMYQRELKHFNGLIFLKCSTLVHFSLRSVWRTIISQCITLYKPVSSYACLSVSKPWANCSLSKLFKIQIPHVTSILKSYSVAFQYVERGETKMLTFHLKCPDYQLGPYLSGSRMISFPMFLLSTFSINAKNFFLSSH